MLLLADRTQDAWPTTYLSVALGHMLKAIEAAQNWSIGAPFNLEDPFKEAMEREERRLGKGKANG